jgi:hypothetical protein
MIAASLLNRLSLDAILECPGEIRCLDSSRGPWIFNLDLDYFFWHDAEQLGLMVCLPNNVLRKGPRKN